MQKILVDKKAIEQEKSMKTSEFPAVEQARKVVEKQAKFYMTMMSDENVPRTALREALQVSKDAVDAYNRKLRQQLEQEWAELRNLREAEQAAPTQQPLTDEQKAVLRECRTQAMTWTSKARIPECGAFGGIAQDLDWLCSQLAITGSKKGGAVRDPR